MQASIYQWSLSQFRLFIVLMVIVGASQGLVSPLISTLLEEQNVSPSVNGISAAMLYMGMFVSMFFCERMLRKIGFRRTIFTGIGIMVVTMALFPVLKGIIAWSILRFFLGVGDNVMTFAVQLWIAMYVTKDESGKRFSQFGLAYGLGLGLGPLGLLLEPFGMWVPFVVLISLLALIWMICLTHLRGEIKQPEKTENTVGQPSYQAVYMVGFLAMWTALIYGFIEVSIANNFAVYGLKIELSKAEVSILITTFIWMSLALQLPLGLLGDKIGRKKLLTIICTIGGIGMLFVPIVGDHFIGLVLLLGFLGGIIGSLFGISLAFVNDLLPDHMVTRGNMLTTLHFTVGSMIGPYIAGILMQKISIYSLFYFLAGSLFSFVFFRMVHSLQRSKRTVQ